MLLYYNYSQNYSGIIDWSLLSNNENISGIHNYADLELQTRSTSSFTLWLKSSHANCNYKL